MSLWVIAGANEGLVRQWPPCLAAYGSCTTKKLAALSANSPPLKSGSRGGGNYGTPNKHNNEEGLRRCHKPIIPAAFIRNSSALLKYLRIIAVER